MYWTTSTWTPTDPVREGRQASQRTAPLGTLECVLQPCGRYASRMKGEDCAGSKAGMHVKQRLVLRGGAAVGAMAVGARCSREAYLCNVLCSSATGHSPVRDTLTARMTGHLAAPDRMSKIPAAKWPPLLRITAQVLCSLAMLRSRAWRSELEGMSPCSTPGVSWKRTQFQMENLPPVEDPFEGSSNSVFGSRESGLLSSRSASESAGNGRIVRRASQQNG